MIAVASSEAVREVKGVVEVDINATRILVLTSADDRPERVTDLLATAGLIALFCEGADALAEEARAGSGAWLLLEEALDSAATAALGAVLAEQPSWSDIPIVVITREGEISAECRMRLVEFGHGGNVSLVERPFRPDTLVSALQMALRARRRQYQVRDLLTQSALDSAILRRSEEQARSILESITDGFFTLDGEWRFTFINAEGERILNRCRSDLLGQTLWEAYPGLEGSEFERTYHRTISERVSLTVTAFYPLHQSWYEARTYPGDQGLSVCFQNVTERQQTDLALRASEERLRSANALLAGITEGTDDLIAALDNDLRFTAANGAYQRAFFELFGKEARVGESMVTALAELPEEKRQVVELWERALSGETFTSIGEFGDSGRIRRIYDVLFYPLRDAGGAITGAALIAADVTARIEMERKLEEQAAALERSRHFLQDTIDALPLHIAVLDADGTILEVNAAWRRFADENGYIGSSYGVGSNYLEILDNQPSGACLELDVAAGIRAVITGEVQCFQGEYPCHSPTEQRWYLMTVSLIQDPGSARVVVAHENITPRVLANLALRDADRRKDEFLAMLAHELRNPLASVTNAVTLLREGAAPEEREWAAEVIARQSSQLARLVDDLLDVSRITQGKIELRKARLDAARSLESACEAIAPLIAARSHTLLAEFPRDELWLDADPTRLEQIIVNLLANAARYTEPHGRISVTGRQEGEEIVIVVSDSGIGIPHSTISQMFELFAQGERSSARSEGGLGIGLTVVRGLCELHGGSVEAHSDGAGTGSTFTVRLPAADRPGSTGTALGLTAKGPTGEGRHRILVVDDNADTVDGLGRLLVRRGYTIAIAHDGISALEKAREFAPDAVLLDIGLPGMDGYEVARRLRNEPCCTNALIIAVSGYGQEEDHRQSRAAGFDHHFVKPVDFGELHSLLAQWLVGRE